MDQFSQQLANLQRAASRAGSRDDGGSGGGRGGGGGRSSSGRGADHYSYSNNDHGNRRHYNDRGGRGSHRGRHYDGRGRSSTSSHYNSRDDDRYRSRDDNGYNNSSSSPRKRTRTDDHDGGRYDRNNRDYQGRGSSYRGGRGGRGGGRFNPPHDDNYRRRNNDSGDYVQPRETPSVPLSELVEKVAQKHKCKSPQAQDATVDVDVDVATQNNMRPKSEGEVTTKKRRHIALLFLTIDNLPHEHIWKEWLKSSSENDDDVMVSVLCHAKFPERIRSPWLRQRHLLRRNMETKANEMLDGFHSRRPDWGSIEITRAMIDLVEEGLRIGSDEACARYLCTPGYDRVNVSPDNHLPAAEEATADVVDDTKPKFSATSSNGENHGTRIPPVDRFVFVSESCLPVSTLKEMEMALLGPKDEGATTEHSKSTAHLYDKSWINARSTPNNGYARQLQWDAIRQSDIPHKFVWKADQWCVLTRAHGQAIASIPQNFLEGRHLWPALKKCRASDEMYFPTALSILGILHRPSGVSEVEDSSSNKKENCAGEDIRRRKITYCDWSMGARNPASFTAKDWKEVVAKARGEGCLLARKFVPSSSQRGGGKRSNGNAEGGKGDGLVSVEDWRSAVVKRDS